MFVKLKKQPINKKEVWLKNQTSFLFIGCTNYLLARLVLDFCLVNDLSFA